VIEDPDPFQLQRFVDAQQDTFEIALTELQTGRKQSHWIWLIFPQLAGLGGSPTASFYGVRSVREARAYLAHPVLGDRYRKAVEAMLSWADRKSAVEVLGEVDAMKLRSSLTLFESVSGDPLFARALDAFYDRPDQATLQLIGRN
jgi:uncharacterized protein (DUF1810 family)